jgi:hypothetical protein
MIVLEFNQNLTIAMIQSDKFVSNSAQLHYHSGIPSGEKITLTGKSKENSLEVLLRGSWIQVELPRDDIIAIYRALVHDSRLVLRI